VIASAASGVERSADSETARPLSERAEEIVLDVERIECLAEDTADTNFGRIGCCDQVADLLPCLVHTHRRDQGSRQPIRDDCVFSLALVDAAVGVVAARDNRLSSVPDDREQEMAAEAIGVSKERLDAASERRSPSHSHDCGRSRRRIPGSPWVPSECYSRVRKAVKTFRRHHMQKETVTLADALEPASLLHAMRH